MKNKRGFLLGEETVKIILSVIAISFLVYFLVTLYYSNETSQELQLAKSTLENIDSQISLGRDQIDIYNPSGNWYLVSWSNQNLFESSGFPERCSSQGWDNCLCICEKSPLNINAQLCQNNGVCINRDFAVNEAGQSSIKIDEPPLTLNINYQDKTLTRAE